MKNINTLSDFKDFIQTPDYWADTWAISTIERLYNVKLIINGTMIKKINKNLCSLNLSLV